MNNRQDYPHILQKDFQKVKKAISRIIGTKMPVEQIRKILLRINEDIVQEKAFIAIANARINEIRFNFMLNTKYKNKIIYLLQVKIDKSKKRIRDFKRQKAQISIT